MLKEFDFFQKSRKNYSTLDALYAHISRVLKRSVKSIQRRREKLKRLNKEQVKQLFDYSQKFQLDRFRRVVLTKTNQFKIQKLNQDDIDSEEQSFFLSRTPSKRPGPIQRKESLSPEITFQDEADEDNGIKTRR